MAASECSAFSEDCKYFSYCGPDGKLKIWDTSSGILKQEFTPNLHLSSPCTCLTWISTSRRVSSGASTPRKKQKRKLIGDGSVDVVAMGTRLGNIMLYSVASGTIVGQLEGVHNGKVNHLTWNANSNLYSCSDDKYIVEWDISNNTCKSKWEADKDQVTSILVLPDGESLLSANRTIQWWDLSTKELKKSFIGHATEVYKLILINTSPEKYFLSSAKGDRFLNVWSLNPSGKSKQSVASFVAEDVVTVVSVLSGDEVGPTNMAAVTRSGTLHLYRHQLNGRSLRPLKPALTVQIASNKGQVADAVVQPIPILSVYMCDSDTVLIAHGNYIFLTFERISSSSEEKYLCFLRQGPRETIKKDAAISKLVTPETDGDVEYVAPAVAPSTAFKRNRMGQQELPIEKKLERLMLNNKPESSSEPGPPSADSLAQLLVQGLQSKDKKILQDVLLTKDTKLINSTVLRLPLQVIVPFVQELTTLMQRKLFMCQVAAEWLKALLSIHAGHLLATPETNDMFTKLLSMVELRMSVLAPLMRLRGRLDLLVGQIEDSSSRGEVSGRLVEPALVYQEPDSSDEASDQAAVASDSEDHWDEFSEEDEEEEVDSQVKEEEDDVDMSN